VCQLLRAQPVGDTAAAVARLPVVDLHRAATSSSVMWIAPILCQALDSGRVRVCSAKAVPGACFSEELPMGVEMPGWVAGGGGPVLSAGITAPCRQLDVPSLQRGRAHG
jgi:hypothetical protein